MAAASPRAVVALTTPHSQRPFSTSSKAPTLRLQSLYNTVGFTSTSQRPIPVLHPIKQKSVIDVQKRPHPIIIQLGAKRRGYLNISFSRLVINCEISNSCSSSLYSMLGVEQNVAIPEIKRAYRNLALRFHPDVLYCNTADVTEVTQKFLQLQNAYSVLSDPELRAYYDYHLVTNSIATREKLGFDSNKSGLRMSKSRSRSKDLLVRASWKSQWEAQIRKLRWGYASAEQESHRRTWGSRMRTEQNTPNHTTF